MVWVTPQMVYVPPPLERINLNVSLQLNNVFFWYCNMERIDGMVRLISFILPIIALFIAACIVFISCICKSSALESVTLHMCHR